MADPIATILSQETVFQIRIFHFKSVTFQYTQTNGEVSPPITHLVLDRNDSVGVLLHDLTTDEIVLVEQFRIAAFENGPGWLLEIPAGRIEDGDEAEPTARREAKEETGADPAECQFISSFYLSPGGCSERLSLFYCPFPDGLQVLAHAGLAHENEDLRVHRVNTKEAYEWIREGKIIDAKTIIALQWLHNRTFNEEE